MEQPKLNKQRPLIAIVGSTKPTAPYSSDFGVRIGTYLRGYIENRPGTLFSGGVSGVGVDVYTGILKYCINAGMSAKKVFPDRFFVMAPLYANLEFGFSGAHEETRIQEVYQPPEAYTALAALTPKGTLDIVRSGQNMDERRKLLALSADALFVMNGGEGTLDEACHALYASKPVITLPSTGGAARALLAVKEGRHLRGIDVRSFQRIDKELIRPVQNGQELRGALDRLYGG